MKIILGNAPIKNGNRGCVALTITIACMIDEIMKKARTFLRIIFAR